jgi:hypothetical protein
MILAVVMLTVVILSVIYAVAHKSIKLTVVMLSVVVSIKHNL